MSEDNRSAVRRAVAEADGWKVVNPPEYGGLWYAIDPKGKYHLINSYLKGSNIEGGTEGVWRVFCSSQDVFSRLPYYDSNLNDIWPLFKKHGLARTGLVMSSFLQSEPQDAAFRLCEIFLELLEEQKDELESKNAPHPPK